MKCLFNYSPLEFLQNTQELVEYWLVRKGNITERFEFIKDTKRYYFFKNLISFSEMKANDTEIISWLDGMKQIFVSLI